MPTQITLFADFTSLASYVTEAAVWRLAARSDLLVRCRAFERFPGVLPVPSDEGEPPADQLLPLAEALGLSVGAPSLHPRTQKAHEAARFAGERGLEERLRMALYHAYWSEGRDIGRIDVLQEVATSVGLDSIDVKIALDIDRHRDEVAADGALGRRLGIEHPPVLFVGTGPGARILAGAQTLAALESALGSG